MKRKGTLSLKELKKLYKAVERLPQDDFIIKWWFYPFLWALWLVKGHTLKSERLKMYWVEFRNTRYLIKTIDL
jgi:hypothetical protein